MREFEQKRIFCVSHLFYVMGEKMEKRKVLKMKNIWSIFVFLCHGSQKNAIWIILFMSWVKKYIWSILYFLMSWVKKIPYGAVFCVIGQKANKKQKKKKKKKHKYMEHFFMSWVKKYHMEHLFYVMEQQIT